MFNYSLKIRIILALILVAIFLIAIVLVREHDAKANDLKIIYQAQKIAEGLEKYHTKFNAYPDSPRIDVATLGIISDQGVNKNGAIVFFRERLEWDRPVYLKSDSDLYVLEFDINKKWTIWNIDSREGAVCNINNGIRMICENKPATFLDYFR